MTCETSLHEDVKLLLRVTRYSLVLMQVLGGMHFEFYRREDT